MLDYDVWRLFISGEPHLPAVRPGGIALGCPTAEDRDGVASHFLCGAGLPPSAKLVRMEPRGVGGIGCVMDVSHGCGWRCWFSVSSREEPVLHCCRTL